MSNSTNLIQHLLPLITGTEVLAHPELSPEALATQIDGDLRHTVRLTLGHAGFLVDLLWSQAAFQEQVRQAIRNEIARVAPASGAEATPAPADQPGSPAGVSGTGTG